MEYSWAKKFPDLHKILTLFQLTDVANPLQFCYKSVTPILQDGPQCGLVALAMCTNGNQNDILKYIFESAKQKNFTYNGEIFSVQYMAKLAKEFINDCTVDIFEGDLNSDFIKDFLLRSGLILVPYDTDKDNSPGFFKGHKAHWALINGGIQTNNGFFVTARHGKAKNVAIWNLKTLAHSNKQLFEFSPDRKLHSVEYKLPEGGISGSSGLNQKSVLIKFV